MTVIELHEQVTQLINEGHGEEEVYLDTDPYGLMIIGEIDASCEDVDGVVIRWLGEREGEGKCKVDRDGVHIIGCECRECTKTNRTCPECGTKYWSDPEFPEMEECGHCMWTPFKETR
jgi:hypothetical protein